MRLRLVLCLPVALLWASGSSAWAEEVVQLWRSAEDMGGVVAVNPTDGSCWAGGREVVRLSAEGQELWRGSLGSFRSVRALSVDPRDGSCWVADVPEFPEWPELWEVTLTHLSANGDVLWRQEGFRSAFTASVSANASDGSCWVGGCEVVHLSAEGKELWRGGPFVYDCALQHSEVAVNPRDGSCYVSGSGETTLMLLSAAGDELWRSGTVPPFLSISSNAYDGSCWITGSCTVHVAADGTELWRGEVKGDAVSVNPVDGSCWIASGSPLWPRPGLIVHLASDGAELWRSPEGMFTQPSSVSVDPVDGSCWVADGEITHLGVVGYPALPFRDILPWHWAYPQVVACANADIVRGYDDARYHPEYAVTRDQMAVFISRSIATPTGPGSLEEYVPLTTPSFSDVPTDFWCYKYIEYAVEHDIVGGYGDGTYQPQVTIDRGQMAVFIARAMAGDDESVPDPTGDPSFPDVPADFWSYRHIEYIAAQQVAGGYYDGLYHPEIRVARDQMAVFICRAFDLPM